MPLNATLDVAVKLVPVIVTVAPAGPLDGLKPLIVGGLITLKPVLLVALPPGVMTLIVNHYGDVYQKDLGPNTATLAAGIHEYNPDESWTKVTD